MRRFLTHYEAFFRHPDVPRLLAMALVMRMPVGMMSLAMLMHLRELSGSFAFAGGMVGTYLVAMAASAPVQGRVIDRYGPRGALLVTGVVQPLLLGLLLLARPLHLALAAIAPLAALAGAFVPPVSVLTRTLWRHRFEKPDERRTAFAIDSALIAICSIGSGVGGLAYGFMHFALPLERQLPRLLLVMAVPLGAHALVTSAWILAPLALVAGFLIAPALTALSLLVTHYAPARYATEAFTWMSTCIVIGVGAGMAVGGQLVDAVGPWAAFASAAGAGVAAAIVSLPLRQRSSG